MKVLVTGCAGFIGMHVSKLLLARGDEVVGIDNLNDYYDPKLKSDRLVRLPGLRFLKIDIADRRWDTSDHRDGDPRRLSPNGEHYMPWHDTTMLMWGPVAGALGEPVDWCTAVA